MIGKHGSHPTLVQKGATVLCCLANLFDVFDVCLFRLRYSKEGLFKNYIYLESRREHKRSCFSCFCCSFCVFVLVVLVVVLCSCCCFFSFVVVVLASFQGYRGC